MSKHLLIIALLCTTQFAAHFTHAAQEEAKGLLPEVKLNSENEEVNTEKAFKSEVLITKAEGKAIESLKKIIAKKKGAPDEADLNYRLAELYMRRAKSGRFFDLNDGSTNKLDKLGVQSQKSIESLKLAIEIYNKIEKQFPNYAQLDEVLFNNALAHSQTKQIERSKDLYNKLTHQFPKSMLIPDALLEVGELYYNQQNFTVALEKFKAIEKYTKSKAYPYGLYKSAWALYNLKRTDEGIVQLAQVIKINPADAADEKKYNLRKEALRDLTLFVGENTPPDQLYGFFKKICTESELGEVVFNLASIYESHSRFKEISIFANEYINEYPSSEQSSKVYTKLIDAEETLKNRPQVIAHLKKFGAHCAALVGDSGKPCKDEFRKVSLEISKKWWDIWLKNKSHAEFSKLTEQSFEILLSQEDVASPDSSSRYAYAELLFQLGKFDQAQANYSAVSNHKGIDKTRAHDSVYGALFSIEKQLEKTKDEAQVAALTAQQKDLAQRYVKEFPNGEHFESLQFKLGFIAYQQKDYDKSLEILMPFTAKSKNAQLKSKSEDIVLDIYNVKKDFKKIMAFSGQVEKSATDEKRKKYLGQINEEANFAQVQVDSESLKVDKKIQLLKDFALAHKDSKLGQDSLWQCVSLAFANGLDVMGADLSLDYVKAYPSDKKNLDAVKDAAKSYVEAGQLKKAISTFRELARLEPTKTLAHLETSCDLLRVNSQLPEARGCYKALFEKADKTKKVELLTKMMKAFGDKKNTAELESIENQILRDNIEPYATQVLISKAKALLVNKKYTEAFNLSMKINSRPVDADARAEARLIQAAVLEQEFITQSVKARENKFSMVLAMKTEKFDKAFTAYSSTIKMSKTDSIQAEALQGIDRLYANFIEALQTMPVPQSLTPAERDGLKAELAKMSVPFQEKRKDNLTKLRQVSKLSASNSELINWADYSIEKTVEPRLFFPAHNKLTHYLPSSLSDYKEYSRLPASDKKCDLAKPVASSIGGCIQMKKYADAEKLALKLTETKEQRAIGLYYLSVIADANDESDKALWMIEKAQTLEPSVAFFHFQKGKVLYSVEGINSALPNFEKAFDIKKSSKEITVMNALKSFSDRDFITASAEFSQLNSEDLYNFNVAVLYVESILQKGETAEAVSLVQRLVNAQPKNVDMLLEQARIFEEFAMKKEDAISSYNKAMGVAQNADQKDWLKKKVEFLKTNKNGQISAVSVGG
ncbi:adventurous gliding motility protein U [Bdellovibrio sp. qaytius]|nr:adventurous gliding motility protein U [Bdellovibrio sp. qaytius]